MKKPIQFEERPTKTIDATEFDIEFTVSEGSVPAAPNKDGSVSEEQHPGGLFVPGKQAGRQVSRAAATNIRMSDEQRQAAGHHMANLMQTDVPDQISDEQALINAGVDTDDTRGVDPEVTPENLPAVISNALAETDAGIDPQWHQIRHMPGYLINQVRAVGREIFSQFTDIPLDDIQTCTTLTNPEQEVQYLMAWIQRYGQKDDEATMDFEASMPGYGAEVQYWNVEGYGFLVVKDFAGHYVYGWPGGRGVDLEHDNPTLLPRM